MVPCQEWHRILANLTVLVVAGAVAVFSARPYAGAWNDGSRLATVECLVDYHTLAIDQSVFVAVPPGQTPYAKAEPLLLEGTKDKLLIDGRYYSDKSPVPAVLLAGVYQALQWTTGLCAHESPAQFCYWMTLASSGLSYAVAVWCVFHLAGQIGLAFSLRWLLTTSFAFSTVAAAYERHVNNHILLLAVALLLLCGAARLADECTARGIFLVGTLAGLGYTIDLAAGPVLLLCTAALVAYRCRKPAGVFVLALGALPWLVLHHVLNYSVAGTFKPANAVPEYLQWPGSPFGPDNMTGVWTHENLRHFFVYAVALLFGKRGFVGHNLALFLVFPAIGILVGRRVKELPEVVCALAFCAGTWLAYALTSRNYAGVCCSVRWFVPFLGPGYFVLALLLRERAEYQRAFVALSSLGAVLGLMMWYQGPWMKHMVPFFWPIQAAALLSWVVVARQQKRHVEKPVSQLQARIKAA